jgi:hypothetical protein
MTDAAAVAAFALAMLAFAAGYLAGLYDGRRAMPGPCPAARPDYEEEEEE